ncbi:hypothetical protein J2S74_000435 [Evansella vedderi]|uniref:Uncharacterized protein n=1 Tax=Evansella vedderi TaxID=38282 RepID=A0ABT9ZPA2_9BACI|nr:hypothetical protein [Evansella vedderi]
MILSVFVECIYLMGYFVYNCNKSRYKVLPKRQTYRKVGTQSHGPNAFSRRQPGYRRKHPRGETSLFLIGSFTFYFFMIGLMLICRCIIS